jgi:hypothetical protein
MKRQTHLRHILVVAAFALVFLASSIPFSTAQAASKAEERPSPAELVRAAVKNEAAASQAAPIRHMFISRKKTAHGSQTKLYVETQDAMAGMVVARNDEPLTPQQEQGELDHLAGLVNSPQQLHNKKVHEKEDADRTLRMVKALPDAFLYEYDGTETGSAEMGHTGDELVRLKFRPNPDYSPPSRAEQVYSGMKGYVLVDAKKLRLAKIDGILFKDVNFGWGILGHLDPGGHFLVQQAEMSDGAWEITHMNLSFKGKALLVKSINISSDEVLSDFQRVPADTTFAKGVQMLKEEQAKLAENHQTEHAAQ